MSGSEISGEVGTAGPGTGLTLWHQTERKLESTNLGPAKGPHLLGHIRGPGLYFFVGENAGGKTTHLQLLLKLHDQWRRTGFENVITDGELSAVLVMEPASITFRKGPTGALREPEAEHVELLPDITEMPPAIHTLISADDLQQQDARARRRLQALLSYAPVDSTDRRLTELFGTLGERLWTRGRELGDGPQSRYRMIESVWDDLVQESIRSKRIRRVEPLRDKESIVAWLNSSSDRDGSILTDHTLLVDLLNATGLCGERALDVQMAKIRKIEGRREEAVTAAARSLEVEPDEEFRLRLEEEYDLVEITPELEAKRTEVATIQVSKSARDAEESRREELRAQHGEAPKVDKAEVTEARKQLQDATARITEAKTALDVAREAEAVADALGESRQSKLRNAVDRVANISESIEEKIFNSADGENFSVIPKSSREEIDFVSAQRRFSESLELLEAALEEYDGADIPGKIEARKQLEVSLEALQREQEEIEKRLENAQKDLEKNEQALKKWEETRDLLEKPIEGNTAAELEEVQDELRELELSAQIARHAEAYRTIGSELATALDLAAAIEQAAKDYRSAAHDSWSFLGALLTDALALPWLQVDGLEIYVGYVGGALNNDPELIETARAAAEQAAAAADNLSPISTPRFILERIRTAAGVEWRNIDDSERISTAELHEACLSVMLARRAGLGGIVVVPWQITAALDEDRLLRFDEQIEEAELVVFSERPRRVGDPDGLFLERVADRREILQRRLDTTR